MNTNIQNVQNAQGNEPADGVERTRPVRVIVPRCDIYEEQGSVHLVAEMPGVDQASIDVTLERQVLTISGRFELPAPEGKRPVWCEYGTGEYRRSFQLSSQANPDNIQASIHDGLLRVDVAKTKPTQRKIPVLSR